MHQRRRRAKRRPCELWAAHCAVAPSRFVIVVDNAPAFDVDMRTTLEVVESRRLPADGSAPRSVMAVR